MKIAAPLALVLAAACVPSEGPMMTPFQDCLGCHRGGEARAWTAAGTWRRGARVTLVDQNGKTVSLRGNDAGNFYTAEALALPIAVSVDGASMPQRTQYGGCNLCHRAEENLTGPLMAAGYDCLGCHGPGGMAAKKFSAAGTFRPGDLVQVGGQTMTANAAGNFYFEAPITFPATARVNGETMSPDPDYGGCNRCHGSGGAREAD